MKNHKEDCQCSVCKNIREGINSHKINCSCFICKSKRGEYKGENHPNYGKIVSNKTRKLHSIALKGKTLSEIGHKSDCQCCFCKMKRGEKKRETHPRFKDGRTLKDSFGNPINDFGVKWIEDERKRKKLQIKRRRFLGGKFSLKEVQEIYEENIKKYGTLTCIYCLNPIEFGKDTLEHKLPLSRGGTNDKENLAIACSKCNFNKGKKTEEEYRDFINKKEVNRKEGD